MITITRALARRLRLVFTRAVGRSPRLDPSPLQFRSEGGGLSISVRGLHVAVEYRHPGPQPAASFAVPLELLKRCEGTSDAPVTLEPQGHTVAVRWSDAGVPQVAAFDAGEFAELSPRPEQLQVNEPRLLTALRDAAACTDSHATRYALSCVQLQGSGGRIAATDAHQLLVQNGFTFPWANEVLVPASPVFACRELHSDEPVRIGRTENCVTLATGAWTVHLRVEKESRFPRIESIVPNRASATSEWRLSAEDREFLLTALPRLPANGEPDSPVTFDLNGTVAVRSKGEGDAKATELILANSRLEGRPIRLEFAVLTKTKAPELVRHLVPATEGQIERTKRIVENVWRAIESELFYPSPSALNCPSCPFRRQCDAWSG